MKLNFIDTSGKPISPLFLRGYMNVFKLSGVLYSGSYRGDGLFEVKHLFAAGYVIRLNRQILVSATMIITKYNSYFYYKVQQLVITKCDSFLLQSATVHTFMCVACTCVCVCTRACVCSCTNVCASRVRIYAYVCVCAFKGYMWIQSRQKKLTCKTDNNY